MAPDRNGVTTFRIGKRCRASCPLYAGSRAPSQESCEPLRTFTPVRTLAAPYVPFFVTTLPTRLHGCSTRCQLFLAESSTVAVYFPCAFTACLRLRRLPTTPRPYGNGPSVLAQSDVTSFQSQTLPLCDLVSHSQRKNVKKAAECDSSNPEDTANPLQYCELSHGQANLCFYQRN